MIKYKFYNENVKKEFIKQKKETTTYAPNYMENVFSQSSVYEEMLDKDVCNWTVGEGISYFKYLNVASDFTIISINKIFYKILRILYSYTHPYSIRIYTCCLHLLF